MTSSEDLPNSIDTAEKNGFMGSCYGHVAVLGQLRGQVIEKERRGGRSVFPMRIITGKEKAFQNKL